MPQLPKLSYVLLSHNREKYIRAAIESAFAQDYEGELEYIFSDDCSTDRTFEIIKECVAAYKGGRRVVVTQPPTNQHLAGNTNHAVQFVESDWIVRADDDDLSSVDRCTIIGKAIAEHPEAAFVATGFQKFTDENEGAAQRESSEPCGRNALVVEKDARRMDFPPPTFACREYSFKAWNANSFRIFGGIDKRAYYADDLICFMRCCVIGSGLYIDQAPVVLMRVGSGNMCRGGDDNDRGYRAIIRLEQFNDRYDNLTYEPLCTTYGQMQDYIAEHYTPETREALAPFMRDWAQTLADRDLLRTYWRKGTLNRVRIALKLGYHGLFSMLRCLPMPVYAIILATIRKLKRKP